MGKLAYSISESEDIAGCGKDLLYSEINSGNLKSIKVGRRRLIRAEALEQWLKDLEMKTSEAMGFGEPATTTQCAKRLSKGISRKPHQRKPNSHIRDGLKPEDETENSPD